MLPKQRHVCVHCQTQSIKAVTLTVSHLFTIQAQSMLSQFHTCLQAQSILSVSHLFTCTVNAVTVSHLFTSSQCCHSLTPVYKHSQCCHSFTPVYKLSMLSQSHTCLQALSMLSQSHTCKLTTCTVHQILLLLSWSRLIVQELCESRGGCPGLSVLTSLLVSVDVKIYWTVLRHWSQLVPNMSHDIWGH